MPGASLALFADLGACHVQKSSVTICVLPTPSGWRATPLLPPISMRWIYFYPRPPGGGRPSLVPFANKFPKFLSTPSGWRATRAPRPLRTQRAISIHALRVEGDPARQGGARANEDFYPRPPGGGRRSRAFPRTMQRERRAPCDFYPRPPGGGRRVNLKMIYRQPRFLSTPSGWRATQYYIRRVSIRAISIHALRVEGDSFCL